MVEDTPSSIMPPTSPQITAELFDALLFTLFHKNTTIYPDNIFVASPRRENFQSPMTTDPPITTYVSVLSATQPLANTPVSTTTQGSFPIPDHAVAAIAAILSYYLPHDIDAQLHNHQWFLIGQGQHPRRTIFIPSSHGHNVCYGFLYPYDTLNQLGTWACIWLLPHAVKRNLTVSLVSDLLLNTFRIT